MKNSIIKKYDDLPLFLNAEQLAQLLGISSSSAYELMSEKGFPSLRIGKRLLIPKDKFIMWADEQSGGDRRG